MDALGHVNNTVYFRYLEQVRIEWMATLGLGMDMTAEGPVIANASCNFRVPLVYPGTVEVKMFLGVPGRSSLPTYYEMRRVGEDTIYADGAAKLVWISTTTGKSIELPEAMRQVAATAQSEEQH
jgi:acyl-CoA thioester hydrolase